MNISGSQTQLMILAFKNLMEYEKNLACICLKYKKRVELLGVKEIIAGLEADSYKRLKRLKDAVEKLNLNQFDQAHEPFDDFEALIGLVGHHLTGHNIYNDYVIRIQNPYVRDILKELRENSLECIKVIETQLMRLKTPPGTKQEIFPVK